MSYAGPLIFAGTLSIDGGSEGDFQTAATTEGAQLTFKGQNFGTVEENAHVYVGPVELTPSIADWVRTVHSCCGWGKPAGEGLAFGAKARSTAGRERGCRPSKSRGEVSP